MHSFRILRVSGRARFLYAAQKDLKVQAQSVNANFSPLQIKMAISPFLDDWGDVKSSWVSPILNLQFSKLHFLSMTWRPNLGSAGLTFHFYLDYPRLTDLRSLLFYEAERHTKSLVQGLYRTTASFTDSLKHSATDESFEESIVHLMMQQRPSKD